MASERTNRMLRLRDGRQLGYAEFGDPHGKPLFLFHGSPGEGHLMIAHHSEEILDALFP